MRRAILALLLSACALAASGGPQHYGRSGPIATTAGGCCSAAPTLRSAGGFEVAAVAISPTLPAGLVSGDLIVATCGHATGTLTASGYTQIATVTQGSVRATAFYRVADGSDTFTTNDSGAWQACQMYAFTTGTHGNIEASATSSTTGSSLTAITLTGPTTTTTNSYVIAYSIGTNTDSANQPTLCDDYSGWANSNLALITERVDKCWVTGDDGSMGLISGTAASSGALGDTTATIVDSPAGGTEDAAHIVIAIKGV